MLRAAKGGMRGRHRLLMTLQLQRQETDERERPRPSSLSSSSKSSTSKKSKQSGKLQARKRSKEKKEAATSRGKMREEGNARSSQQPPQKRKDEVSGEDRSDMVDQILKWGPGKENKDKDVATKEKGGNEAQQTEQIPVPPPRIRVHLPEGGRQGG